MCKYGLSLHVYWHGSYCISEQQTFVGKTKKKTTTLLGQAPVYKQEAEPTLFGDVTYSGNKTSQKLTNKLRLHKGLNCSPKNPHEGKR